MNEYMAIFFTHSGAIKFDRNAKKKSIDCELMPVPRKLSSNCGIGAKFSYDGDLQDVLDEEVEKIFLLNNEGYTLVYEEI